MNNEISLLESLKKLSHENPLQFACGVFIVACVLVYVFCTVMNVYAGCEFLGRGWECILFGDGLNTHKNDLP